MLARCRVLGFRLALLPERFTRLLLAVNLFVRVEPLADDRVFPRCRVAGLRLVDPALLLARGLVVENRLERVPLLALVSVPRVPLREAFRLPFRWPRLALPRVVNRFTERFAVALLFTPRRPPLTEERPLRPAVTTGLRAPGGAVRKRRRLSLLAMVLMGL